MNLSLLKQRNFLLVTLGRFVSLIGTIFQEFALSLYVLNTTGSGTKFASVLVVALIPKLILGPFAGVLADWFDRKKIVVLFDILSGLLVGVFGVLFLINGELTLLQIYSLVTLLSIISVIFNPAISAIIPSIVEKNELADANSINSLVTSLSSILAPILAGLVFGLAGLLPILFINAISFILSGISESFIRVKSIVTKKSDISISKFKTDFVEGIKYVKSDKDLRILLFVAIIANSAIGPMFSICVPYILKQKLLISDFQFGLFEAIACVGPLLASVVAGKFIKKYNFDKIFTFALTISSVLLSVMAISAHPIFLQLNNAKLFGFIIVGVMTLGIAGAIVIANIALSTTMQKRVDIKIMGRVGAVFMTITSAATPLGQIIIGRLLDTTVPTYIIVLVVAMILLIAGMVNYVLYLPKKNVALDEQ